MGVQRCEWTLTNNLILIFLALLHLRNNYADRSMHGNACSDWFLSFNTSQQVLPYLTGELGTICHGVILCCNLLNSAWCRNSPVLSTYIACSCAAAKQCRRALIWSHTHSHSTENLMLCCCLTCGSGMLPVSVAAITPSDTLIRYKIGQQFVLLSPSQGSGCH